MPLPVITTEKPSTSETSETAAGAITNTSEQPPKPISTSQSKSEAEIAADKLYEERIEEEYAKREGGA